MTAPAVQTRRKSEDTRPESVLAKLPPAMRESPADEDSGDQKRYEWAGDKWNIQDAVYRLRDRDIEENIRIIAGQQWWVYHHLLGWQDISYWMSDEEKRWRQRPVFNRILPWYILTHARMTENQFSCGFLPGVDQHDAEVAEMYDALYKTKWRDAGMTDVWNRCASWMIAAGTGFIQTRVDLNKGDFNEWVGQHDLQLLGPDGRPARGRDGQIITRRVGGVPFDENGKPLAELRSDGLRITGKPHRERRGDIVVEVMSPLEVRGQWGPIPWHEQRTHMTRSYLTPEQVWETWGVDVKPDITDLPSGSAGFLERLLFGTGFYGAASSPVHPNVTGSNTATEPDGYASVQSTWMAPSAKIEGMEETEESPGGRLLVTTKNKVLYDGPRPFKCKWTSPIRCYEFIRIPGRPWGSTPLEMMKSPQKSYNQGWKQILENRSLSANPQQVYDTDSGLRADQVDNMPGRLYGVRRKKGVPPIEWITPPAMGADVWRSQDAIAKELAYLGSQSGTEYGAAQTQRLSAKALQEMRFNDDRFVGPTMVRCAEENGRMIEDWRVIFPVIYSQDTLLRYVGEDRAARAIMLLPDVMKSADVTVLPDLESMKPEGRGERRTRVYQQWKDGFFGDPHSPEARRLAQEAGRFPGMSLAVEPGGVHRATARQENAMMLQGQLPVVQEWQDHEVHLDTHETFMATREWERLPDEVKVIFIQHRWQTMVGMVEKRKQAAMMAQAAQLAPTPGAPGAPAEAVPAAAGAAA